jgi:hypothetical protein
VPGSGVVKLFARMRDLVDCHVVVYVRSFIAFNV